MSIKQFYTGCRSLKENKSKSKKSVFRGLTLSLAKTGGVSTTLTAATVDLWDPRLICGAHYCWTSFICFNVHISLHTLHSSAEVIIWSASATEAQMLMLPTRPILRVSTTARKLIRAVHQWDLELITCSAYFESQLPSRHHFLVAFLKKIVASAIFSSFDTKQEANCWGALRSVTVASWRSPDIVAVAQFCAYQPLQHPCRPMSGILNRSAAFTTIVLSS